MISSFGLLEKCDIDSELDSLNSFYDTIDEKKDVPNLTYKSVETSKTNDEKYSMLDACVPNFGVGLSQCNASPVLSLQDKGLLTKCEDKEPLSKANTLKPPPKDIVVRKLSESEIDYVRLDMSNCQPKVQKSDKADKLKHTQLRKGISQQIGVESNVDDTIINVKNCDVDESSNITVFVKENTGNICSSLAVAKTKANIDFLDQIHALQSLNHSENSFSFSPLSGSQLSNSDHGSLISTLKDSQKLSPPLKCGSLIEIVNHSKEIDQMVPSLFHDCCSSNSDDEALLLQACFKISCNEPAIKNFIQLPEKDKEQKRNPEKDGRCSIVASYKNDTSSVKVVGPNLPEVKPIINSNKVTSALYDNHTCTASSKPCHATICVKNMPLESPTINDNVFNSKQTYCSTNQIQRCSTSSSNSVRLSYLLKDDVRNYVSASSKTSDQSFNDSVYHSDQHSLQESRNQPLKFLSISGSVQGNISAMHYTQINNMRSSITCAPASSSLSLPTVASVLTQNCFRGDRFSKAFAGGGGIQPKTESCDKVQYSGVCPGEKAILKTGGIFSKTATRQTHDNQSSISEVENSVGFPLKSLRSCDNVSPKHVSCKKFNIQHLTKKACAPINKNRKRNFQYKCHAQFAPASSQSKWSKFLNEHGKPVYKQLNYKSNCFNLKESLYSGNPCKIKHFKISQDFPHSLQLNSESCNSQRAVPLSYHSQLSSNPLLHHSPNLYAAYGSSVVSHASDYLPDFRRSSVSTCDYKSSQFIPKQSVIDYGVLEELDEVPERNSSKWDRYCENNQYVPRNKKLRKRWLEKVVKLEKS